MSKNPVSKYDGYMLSASNPLKQRIPSNVFKCVDGAYINKIFICDGKIDCVEGAEEKKCFCDQAMNPLSVGCKYFCNPLSQQCSCSTFYFTCLSSFNCIPYLKVCDGL